MLTQAESFLGEESYPSVMSIGQRIKSSWTEEDPNVVVIMPFLSLFYVLLPGPSLAVSHLTWNTKHTRDWRCSSRVEGLVCLTCARPRVKSNNEQKAKKPMNTQRLVNAQGWNTLSRLHCCMAFRHVVQALQVSLLRWDNLKQSLLALRLSYICI